MDINFELYKIFYYAGKYGSFSTAAEQLFISQSAVSQSIKNLEEKLGSPLFHRKTRSVKLTREGELLFKHIEQAFNFIKIAESKLSEIQNMSAGEIRIGVGDTICKYFLIPHLENYSRLYPKVKIQVINRTSSQILSTLKKGIIDVGIVTLPVTDQSISVDDFIPVQDIFVACNKFSQLKNKKVGIRDLAGYPLLMLEKDSATRRNLDSVLGRYGINPTPELELESIDLLVEFAKIGLGIAHVLKESAEESIRNKELFQVKTDIDLPERNLGIATMKDMPLSHAAAEFISIIKNKTASLT
ncbi:MAG: LysR family transcriptional regulator [Clostridia bacterium]|nr:LysR family transcriptional regulator [Clostridia bacterium]